MIALLVIKTMQVNRRLLVQAYSLAGGLRANDIRKQSDPPIPKGPFRVRTKAAKIKIETKAPTAVVNISDKTIELPKESPDQEPVIKLLNTSKVEFLGKDSINLTGSYDSRTRTIQVITDSPTTVVDLDEKVLVVNLSDGSFEFIGEGLDQIPPVKLEDISKVELLDNKSAKIYGNHNGNQTELTAEYTPSGSNEDAIPAIEPPRPEPTVVKPLDHYIDVALAAATRRGGSGNGSSGFRYGGGGSYASAASAGITVNTSTTSNYPSIFTLVKDPPVVNEDMTIFHFKPGAILDAAELNEFSVKEFGWKADTKIIVLDFTNVKFLSETIKDQFVSLDSDLTKIDRHLVFVNVASEVKGTLSGFHADFIISPKDNPKDIKTEIDLRSISKHRAYH